MMPLVLLPGMMCDAQLFTPQIATFSGARAVQVAPITGAENISDLAAEVLTHAPPRFALAGLSMGGIVAMEVFRQAPERIDRIAFLDTNPEAEDQTVAAGREQQIARVQAGELRTIMRDEMKPRYLADGPNRDQILDLCMDMALGLGPDVFVRQSRALLTRPDQRGVLQRINVPTLALCGREDTLCPIHRHEMICSLISGATLEIVEGAGHLPTLEQPEETNKALIRWMEAT